MVALAKQSSSTILQGYTIIIIIIITIIVSFNRVRDLTSKAACAAGSSTSSEESVKPHS